MSDRKRIAQLEAIIRVVVESNETRDSALELVLHTLGDEHRTLLAEVLTV